MNKLKRARILLGFLSVVILLTVGLTACNKETGYGQYKAMAAKELAHGQRVDSLFFGIHLGMSSKQFYAHCWEMNKKGLFTDGENNTAVLYKLDNNELDHPASMNFYPAFYQDKLHNMRVTYNYDAWAPWNKHLFADSLQLKVLELYTAWYKGGNSFIKMEDKKRGTIYVKVDGNRRIIIGKYDDVRVKVDYSDLRVEKEIEEHNEKN